MALQSGLSEAEAEDAVQETVIAVARHMPEFRYDPEQCSFKSWLSLLLRLLHPVLPHVTEEIWTQLPARETRLIAANWPPPAELYLEEADALRRAQEAAERFRRSGVLTPLEGDEKRIFDAVVRPERQKANGDAAAEIARLEGEIRRAEGMLENDRFTAKAPPEVVQAEREKLERFRRELDAIRS